MTGPMTGSPRRSDDDLERRLATRVLNALLRENYGGLAARVTPAPDPAGDAGGAGSCVLTLPHGRRVRLRAHSPAAPGFLDTRWVVPGQPLTLDDVLSTVAAVADARDDVAAFAAECRGALAARRLHADTEQEVFAALAALRRRAPGPRRRLPRAGPADTWYDVLAARLDHPAYPTAAYRHGLSTDELRRYAPEFRPVFRLRWAAVPRDGLRGRAVVRRGRLPRWWPTCADVALPEELAATHVLFPVHPLTVARGGPDALCRGRAAAEPDGDGVVLAPRDHLAVTPTLSMRTVALDRPEGDGRGEPPVHLKLPLPTSTLGARNHRALKPGTLADGALVQEVLAAVLEREPHLPVLLADESTFGHAGHPGVGYLVRRFPAAADGVAVVPVAALLAPVPCGDRLVVEELAADAGGDLEDLLAGYLDALFTWNVRLFVRYGIALEAHQQNVSVVVRPARPPALLLKDGDGTLLDLDRLAAGLAGAGRGPRGRCPSPGDFVDRRLLTDDPELLARVFVTITVHLCAGALAFGLAERGVLPVRRTLGLVRDRLAAALAAYGDDPAARFLRDRTLGAPALPTKAMLTAGTLVDKERTGCRDINKHYGPPGPNYLACGG